MSIRWQLFLVIAVGLVACTTTPAPIQIQRLVIVGDSNVDDGNLFRLTGGKTPASPNWHGRNSNGPNVVDYLAHDLGIATLNVAVSGATSGSRNVVGLTSTYKYVEDKGVTSQLDQLESDAIRLSQTDLVLLWVGSNNLYGISRSDRDALAERIAQINRNIENAVDRLYALGARRFVIVNRTPRQTLGTDNEQNGVDLNLAIAKEVEIIRKRMRGDIRLFDAYATVANMMHNPAQYGFTEASAPCIQLPACAHERYEDGQPLANQYINWDSAHKTTRVHQLMAEQLQQLVQQ